MEFASGSLNGSIDALMRASRGEDRICAENVILEDRMSDKRRAGFESIAGSKRRYKAGQAKYITDKIYINSDPPEIPATFHQDNDLALLPAPALDKILVRVEQLDWPITENLTNRTVFLHNEAAWRNGDATATYFIQKFFDRWNRARDHRPVFAAFHDDVRGAVEADDWAEQLRARLGLGHLNTSRGPALVALMSYPVREVLNGADARKPWFAAPTVLDLASSPYFHPSPATTPGHVPSCGRAVELEEGGGLVCEVLHRRIPYRPEHMKRVVQLSKPLTLRLLKKLREQHIERLLSALDCRHAAR